MKIAVIDTETTWGDEVMSIGMVIADGTDFSPIELKYYVIDPVYKAGGLYSYEMFKYFKKKAQITTRAKALKELDGWLKNHGVKQVYAYNASFDKGHLKEFSSYEWYDIMRIAAYKQYNPFITEDADCCKTGRLKRAYGVEPMTRLISGNHRYLETHNALQDALDELDIMRMLGLPVNAYGVARL
ncbi:MAG: 3'-5' exoribonuclease [Lachnospiraceae bacterium]|nr:3'-5' exoribonuclease [Lachnospiraceae bacterium]